MYNMILLFVLSIVSLVMLLFEVQTTACLLWYLYTQVVAEESKWNRLSRLENMALVIHCFWGARMKVGEWKGNSMDPLSEGVGVVFTDSSGFSRLFRNDYVNHCVKYERCILASPNSALREPICQWPNVWFGRAFMHLMIDITRDVTCRNRNQIHSVYKDIYVLFTKMCSVYKDMFCL